MVKYLCSCDKKYHVINIKELLNKWKDIKNIFFKM